MVREQIEDDLGLTSAAILCSAKDGRGVPEIQKPLSPKTPARGRPDAPSGVDF
ncbi:MAG: hypothetical protein R2875_03355 [Desulfobacterales bacterium]